MMAAAILADSKDCGLVAITKNEGAGENGGTAPSELCDCCPLELPDGYQHKAKICELEMVRLPCAVAPPPFAPSLAHSRATWHSRQVKEACAATCNVGAADTGFSLTAKYALRKVKNLKEEGMSNDDIVRRPVPGAGPCVFAPRA